MEIKFLFLFVLLVIFHKCVSNSDVSFKNVSVWSSPSKTITTIASSNTLKEHLPANYTPTVYILGNISILYENSVIDIDSVSELRFHRNEICEIKRGAFNNLSIKVLEISGSNFTDIRGVFDNLTLEKLNLGSNEISRIAFKNLEKLGGLSLGKNKIEKIENGVLDNLPKLEILDLSQNSISKLPPGLFKNLPSLRYVILNRNKLSRVDGEIFDSASLEYLDLANNSVTTIPENFFDRLPKLREVILSLNLLTRIPTGVFKNRNLTHINLHQNKISYIAPDAFDNMPRLANVRLTSNQLKQYDTKWFHNTPNMYRLFLSNNLLEDIPDQAFKNIYNDKEQWIRLNENKIKKISRETFKGLKKFDSLDLADNEMEIWHEDFLADVVFIRYLNLRNNKITCPGGDFGKIFKANYTYLADNPLGEKCRKKIEEWASKNKDKVVCVDQCFLY